VAHWIAHDWPRIKRLVYRWHAHLVFIDETGYLLHPLVLRTWAQRGRTPKLDVRMRSRRKLSAIGAISVSPMRRRFGRYVALHRDKAISQEQTVDFLRQLRRHLSGSIVIVWDNLSVHRGCLVKEFLDDHRRTLRAECLPPYAPELNPVEYSWGYDKGVTLANACPHDIDDLERQVNAAIAPTCRDQLLLRGFIKATGLPFRM